MQHTDFYTLYRLLKKNELKELADAVNAHNGHVSFQAAPNWDAPLNAPVVLLNLDNGPIDVIITDVSLRGGHLVIKGYEKDDIEANVVEIDSCNILPGQICSIIDAIPETQKVQTVTAFNDAPVLVTCYGKTKAFPSRTAAIDFFWDCVVSSEGAERDRYIDILIRLKTEKGDI